MTHRIKIYDSSTYALPTSLGVNGKKGQSIGRYLLRGVDGCACFFLCVGGGWVCVSQMSNVTTHEGD